MSRPLTSYKRLFVSYGVENKYTQMTYNALLSGIAKNHNLSFTVIPDPNTLVNGIKVRVVDNMEGLGDVSKLYKNQLIFYHVGNNAFEPSFESFFFDSVFFKIPSKKSILQGLLRAVHGKDKKVKFLDNLLLFEQQLGAQDFNAAKTTLSFIAGGSLTSGGVVNYLEGRLALRSGQSEDAFEFLKEAFANSKANPLVYNELQDFFYKLNQKDEALAVCTKYVQKFPASSKITGRGIELSVMTKQFGNLDLFYKCARVIKKAAGFYYSVYNAGLSVFIRYLIRNKQYGKISNYLELLANSSEKQVYWESMLSEVIGELPLEFWINAYSTKIEKIMTKYFVEASNIIGDYVRLGPEAAKGTAALAARNNPRMSACLRKLIEQFGVTVR